MPISIAHKNLMSKTLVMLPVLRQANTVAKEAIETAKVNLLETDGVNGEMMQIYLESCNEYHNELKLLNGVSYTNYDESEIDLGANKSPGNLHFPENWINFQPKKIDSSIGLPISLTLDVFETELIDAILFITSRNGVFEGHTYTGTVNGQEFTVAENQGVINYSVGDYVSFDGIALIAIVVSVMPSRFTFKILTNGSIQNGTIEVTSSLHGDTDIDFQISSTVRRLIRHAHGIVVRQQQALQRNPDITEQNTEAMARNTEFLNETNTWATETNILRLRASGYSNRNTVFTRRSISIRDRPRQIVNLLVNFNQSSDGSFTGTGPYFKLFSWIDARINQATGTLSNVAKQDSSLEFFDQKTANLDFLEAQYSQAIEAVVLASSAVDAGMVSIEVTDNSMFTANDEITLVDDSTPTNYETLTILNIDENGSTITFTSPLVNSYNPAAIV